MLRTNSSGISFTITTDHDKQFYTILHPILSFPFLPIPLLKRTSLERNQLIFLDKAFDLDRNTVHVGRTTTNPHKQQRVLLLTWRQGISISYEHGVVEHWERHPWWPARIHRNRVEDRRDVEEEEEDCINRTLSRFDTKRFLVLRALLNSNHSVPSCRRAEMYRWRRLSENYNCYENNNTFFTSN